MSRSRTTIARSLIELIKLGKADKDEILRHLEAGTSGAAELRRGEPALTVEFRELREPGTAAPADDVYRLVDRVGMYHLTDADRVDVLTFGRHPGQDVQLLDMIVSREHGLIIYGGRLPLFCDYGTLDRRAPGHAGTTNGTYLDGATLIHDAMITWLPHQALMLGEVRRDVTGRQRYRFMVTYKLHLRAPDDPNLN